MHTDNTERRLKSGGHSRQRSDGKGLDAWRGGVTDNLTGYNNRITEDKSTIRTNKNKKRETKLHLKRTLTQNEGLDTNMTRLGGNKRAYRTMTREGVRLTKKGIHIYIDVDHDATH